MVEWYADCDLISFNLILNSLESAGGKDIHVNDTPLPRAASECNSPEDLSPEIRTHLSSAAQQLLFESYNEVFKTTSDKTQSEATAWDKVCERFDEDEYGVWSKEKTIV